jgi:hypothetical protein
MEPTVTDPAQMIARAEARSNVFLTALIDTPEGTLPVRVRNLSPCGALLEGHVLPVEGEILLRRGHLYVSANVAWRHDGYCGLHFNSTIEVTAWLKRIGHQGQERVDQIMASLRTGAVPRACDPAPLQGPAEIAEALLEIADRLAAMDGLSLQADQEILKIDTLARVMQSWSGNARAA